MNRTYSIRIRHYRTQQWTHTSSVTTCAPIEQVQQQYEKDYGQPVQVVEVTESQLHAIQDNMMNSVLVRF